jgi:predicted MFS family arabinose efflux permease
MTPHQTISRKQLIGLFLCTFFNLSVGVGLLPLLPVLATNLGGRPSGIGIYMAITYLGLTVGTLVAGGLVARYPHPKRLLILSSAAIAVPIFLMGQASSLVGLTAATTLTWFIGGIAYTVSLIIAGQSAGPHQRGLVFGLMGANMSLGALGGGPLWGALADRLGYEAMLSLAALYILLVPLVAFLLIDEPVAHAAEAGRSQAGRGAGATGSLGMGFLMLVLATVLMASLGFVLTLGRSLAMDVAGFSAAQIGSAVAFGGLVGAPLPFLVGALSDRWPRHWLLVASYGAVAAAALLLASSQALWHFWAASMLLAVNSTRGSLTNALTTDLVPPALVSRGLSVMNATTWAGAILGFGLTGFAIESLGMQTTFLFAAMLALPALLLLAQVRPAPQPVLQTEPN